MDISEMEIKDLKALAYDQIALLEQTQKNLNAINQEIAKRSQLEVKEEAKPEDKK